MAAPLLHTPNTPPAAPRALATATAERLARFAADPQRCAALLSGTLRAFTSGAASLVDLRVGDAIAGRRGKAFLLIDTRLRDAGSADTRTQRFVFEFFADDDGRKVLWRMGRRGLSGARRAFARYIPDEKILIHEFPFDYRLETLGDAFSGPRMLPRFAAMTGDRAMTIDMIDVVRYVPEKRCLLRYGVTVEGAEESWLGKVYVHDDDLVSGRIQRALWDASRTGAGPCVPEVVGILPDVRLVVQRHVDGTSVYDSLRAGSLTTAHLAATARAARALHHAPVTMPRQHTWHDELAVVRGAVERSSLAGDTRDAAHAVCTSLACASVDRQPRVVPVHRDFYDKQVLVTPGGITLIDFDTASASYPELDVANFVAHLWLRSLQGYVQAGRAADYALGFVSSYLDEGALDVARYRLTLATTWLRLAAVYAMRPLWQQLSPALVDVAARAAHGPAEATPLGLTRALFAAGARR